MRRHVSAVIALLCLNPVWLYAQGPAFTVGTPFADVHAAPSVASPVLGQAQRGAALPVTRELGSWVKVAWPVASDGIGYVHVSLGTTTGGSPSGITSLAGTTSALTVSNAAEASSPVSTTASAASVSPGYVVAPAHVVGLGGQMGNAAVGSGLSTRTWITDRLGLQLEVARSPLTDPVLADRRTAVHFSPSVLFALPNLLTDYVWVRPYLGSGPRLLRQTVGIGLQASGLALSQNSFGFQAFGGSELTLASIPRFTLSADLRYGWVQEDEVSFELGGLGFAVSAHWYVK